MKKRRVLALLLALSMVTGMNGVTVLAAEPVVSDISVVDEEGDAEITEIESPTDDRETNDSEEADEADGQDESEIPGEEDASDNSDGDSAGEDSENNDTESPDAGAEDDALGGEENAEESEDDITAEDDTQESEVIDGESDEDAPEDEEVSEDTEVVAGVRMMTFTDDTGMRITYDAVQATAFTPNISEEGVLTGVEDAEGVVDLRQETTITSIGEGAFQDNTKITYVMLPKTVQSIGESAFDGCTALKGISIPSRLTSVGDNAFKGCISLTQLALPNSVISIGTSAFENDSRLFMVHMVSAEYSKLETIGDSAFKGCSALEFFCSDEEYSLPDSITSIGNEAFYGCGKIDRVIMGDGISSLGTGAYQNCSGIKEVLIAGGLSQISEYAFANCTSLMTINFSSTKKIKATIKAHAFSNCTKLGTIELTSKIELVETYAFEGCTALKRVVVKDEWTVLQEDALPNTNEGLCLVGGKDSDARDYAQKAGIRFVIIDDEDASKKEYYTYTTQLTGPSSVNLALVSIKVTKEKTNSAIDINSITNSDGFNGVEEGTPCYLSISTGTLTSVVQVVSGSVKCNGTTVKASEGYYTFNMPAGGAVISVELEYKDGMEGLVEGSKDSIEGRLSSDVNYDYNSKTGYMKVGQSTKFYLTNNYGGVTSKIPTSKVAYRVPSQYTQGVVSVDGDGTVKALKEGTTVVEAEVKTTTGDVSVEIGIVVEAVGIDHISMLVTDYDKNSMSLESDAKGDIGISVPKTEVNKDLTFSLEAVAFSSEENDEKMGVAFTWATSDSKVAKLAKTSTTAASAVNTVTIPLNTDGEATITVTATDANKKKVTQKFTVSVEDYTPRLGSSKITINPKQLDGTTKLEIIGAYGKEIDTSTPVTIYDSKTSKAISGLRLEWESTSGSVYTYKAIANSGIAQTTYSAKIQVKVKGIVKPYEIPLSIVVKESIPNPTVSFDKKQPKINLFYKNDGTKIKTEITKLGDDEVSEYVLKPLTTPDNDNYVYDENFIKNFEIDKEGVITQKIDTLLCNKSNKPVVTGYLELHFEGYKPDVYKQYKITIPTETVAPSYVLNKTSGTYNQYCSGQAIELQLLDKKNKNAPVELSEDGGDHITVMEKSTTMAVRQSGVKITEDGKITLEMSGNPEAGKVYLELTNDKWAAGKSFTYVYTIKTSSADPTISLSDGPGSLTSLKSSTVTLNPNYKEQIMSFGLKSNQEDTVIAEEQTFVPQSTTDKTAPEYAKLSVTYENGEGRVFIKEGYESVAPGTYTFVCENPKCTVGNRSLSVKKITLKVKVAATYPTVTAKGSLSFNGLVKKDGQFIEKSELTLTVKNLPEGYVIDSDKTIKSITCTTKNKEDYEQYFNWQITDEGNLQVSMKSDCSNGTYKFSIEPVFTNKGQNTTVNEVKAKKLSFSVKVYSGNPSVSLSAKGKLNLLDRTEECTTSNSIVYTPTIKNLKDTVKEAKIYDSEVGMPDLTDSVSEFFEVTVSPLDGKLYVTPREGVTLENNKTYKVRIWMKLTNYEFDSYNNVDEGGIWNNKTLSIKTAQILPKVTTDKSEVNLYLSNKDYVATFIVDKKDEKSIGAIESITFGEKDTKAQESFVTSMDPITGENIVIDSEPLDDGSLKVNLKLKNGVAYGCNTTNKITMYVRFKGQGSNTAGTGISMKVKINK